jgi:HlyD family secretion protein
MRRLIAPLVLAVIVGVGVLVYVKVYTTPPGPEIIEAAVTEGDITEAAIATGTLSALRTVDIGTEVSGTVQKLDVDFNSIVHKGEVIAELDPALFQQDLDSAEAAKDRAEIDLEEEQATLEVDQHNLERVEALRTQDIETQQDREQAELQVKEDQAVIKQDQAAVAIANANIEQSKVDLAHCTVKSPIDGVVISRNVDEGQTVTARLAAPTLFVLATDLTRLQIVADVDESDVSRIRAGQTVGFTVDAYAGHRFEGKVTIVRLNATTTNNVVTYQVVADVPNPDLRLMPGMTATIGIEIWNANDVLRIPSAALRYRPVDDVFATFGQPVPPEAHVRLGSPAPVAAVPAHAGAATPLRGGSTIDVFFQAVPRPDAPGQVWVMRDRKLTPLAVHVGVTDGTWTELLAGGLVAGDEVVTNVVLPAQAHRPAATSTNPLMPPSRGAPPPRATGR